MTAADLKFCQVAGLLLVFSVIWDFMSDHVTTNMGTEVIYGNKSR